MRKFLAFFICLTLLFSLLSCTAKYERVPSTAEEERTVWTLKINDDTYEVKYELYRAFFLSIKNSIDGGDNSVWKSADKDEYIQLIDRIILGYASDIYAAFAVCKTIGFDVYSRDVERTIEEYVTASVEGGVAIVPTWEGIVTDVTVKGNGSYEEYLKSLKEMNLNYSTQELLYRYYVALRAIDTYYIGTYSEENIDGEIKVGAYEYSKDDVFRFYMSEDCVRVLRHSFSANISYTPQERAERDRAKIADAAMYGESEVVNCIIGLGAMTSTTEISAGSIIGRYNLDEAYAAEYTAAAFDTGVGLVSPVIEINDGLEHSYNVLYRAEKSEEHFNANYSSIAYVYLKNAVGKILYDTKTQLQRSAVPSEVLSSIDRALIKM